MHTATRFACPVLVLSFFSPMQMVSAEDAVLEEIVVTARRMQESLQDVPSSISTLSSEFIRSERIQNVDQIIALTPGATFTSFHKGQQDFSMRGISSQTEGAAGDSGVATYVDNIVIGSDFAKSLKIMDVEQVEILRGPQGTAFGRNASAGLLHIINRRPTQENEAMVEATVGNYSLMEVNAYLNGGLSDNSSGRLSFHFDDRDGFTKDLSSGRDVDYVRNTSLRGQWRFTPTQDFDLLLKLEWSEDDDGAPIRRGPDCTKPYLEPPFGNFTEPSCDPWKTDVSDRDDLIFTRTIVIGTAEVTWDFTEQLRLTSITGWMDAEMDRFADIFGTPLDVLLQGNNDKASQFSQEFRLDNSQQDSALHWIGGVYVYSDDRKKIGENRDSLSYAGPPFATTTDLRTANKTTSYGIFGQLSYDVGERTNLTVGGRYSSDEKDFSVYHGTEGGLGDVFVDPSQNPINAMAKESWSEFTGSASLSYHFTDDVMLYGLFATGYKAGGFNGEPYDLVSAVTPYDQETSNNLEAGLKSQWLDNRLRLNLSVFHTTYDDLQVVDFLPSGTPFIDNSGGAQIDGLELDFSWLVSDSLVVSGSVAALDAELKGDVSGTNVAGNRPDNSPEWTASLAADYTIDLPNGSSMVIRADYNGRSDVFDGPYEDPETVREGVGFLGLRVSWLSSDQNWRLALWGRNLTNEAEVLTFGPAVLVSQNPTGYGPPRTFGATVTRHF